MKVIPGMIRYENSLGGRVAIVAYDLHSNNRSSAVFNYRKKEIIPQTLEWLGRDPLPVYVKNLPNVFCIYNRATTGNPPIITLTNLSCDTTRKFTLGVSPDWRDSPANGNR